MIPLPLKQTQAPEKACFLVNYSLKPGAKQSSEPSPRTKCHEVVSATMCHQVPQADERTHFYVTLTVYVRMLRAQWQESL